jgi:hypothetical protein
MMQMHVHLLQRFLHLLHLLAAVLRQILPVAHQTTHGANVLRGTKRPLQQPVAVQLLQPLAVLHVSFAARHLAQMPRVDQNHLDPGGVQFLRQRNPENPG